MNKKNIAKMLMMASLMITLWTLSAFILPNSQSLSVQSSVSAEGQVRQRTLAVRQGEPIK